MRSYFASLDKDQRLLATHGFDHWPDVDELTRYVFELTDMVTLLASADGVCIDRDARGRIRLTHEKEVR